MIWIFPYIIIRPSKIQLSLGLLLCLFWGVCKLWTREKVNHVFSRLCFHHVSPDFAFCFIRQVDDVINFRMRVSQKKAGRKKRQNCWNHQKLVTITMQFAYQQSNTLFINSLQARVTMKQQDVSARFPSLVLYSLFSTHMLHSRRNEKKSFQWIKDKNRRKVNKVIRKGFHCWLCKDSHCAPIKTSLVFNWDRLIRQ